MKYEKPVVETLSFTSAEQIASLERVEDTFDVVSTTGGVRPKPNS